MKLRNSLLTSLIFLFLAGCSSTPTETASAFPVGPTPTINALLIERQQSSDSAIGNNVQQSASKPQAVAMEAESAPPPTAAATPTVAQPTVAALFGSQNQIALVPTATTRPPSASETELNLVSLSFGIDIERTDPIAEILIYDNELDQNWTLNNSTNVTYSLTSTSRWFEVLDPRTSLHSGSMSVALRPEADFGQLFFTVRPEAAIEYSRDDILGVSFWMHTGNEIVDTGDFAVTVVGSNEKTYWSPDDRSVFSQSNDFFEGEEEFSETALYFLDINRAIPANSWFKIEVWLDELLFDPDYEYVTGVYIKNDAGFRHRVYIDKLSLLTLKTE